MKIRSILATGAAAASLLLATLSGASAVTIASFTDTTADTFAYTNATGTFLHPAGTADFNFKAASGCPTATIKTLFSVDGAASGAIIGTHQSIDVTSPHSFKFVHAVTGMTVFEGEFTGDMNLDTPRLGHITADEGAGDTVSFTIGPGASCSTLLFPDKALNWTVTSATAFGAPSGGNFHSFKATISGEFIATVVPEPGPVALLIGLGVSGSLFCFKLRRRA